jgi:glycosyltransferase involved in cell wall biosynthesis
VVENGRRPSISVVVPALNEEAHIEDAVRETVKALGDRFESYELLLIDDGSTDRTGEIMDRLAAGDPQHLRVAHNPSPRNLGGVYKQGIPLARYEYYMFVPGDNENPSSALKAPFDALGKAEIIVPYVPDPKRSRLRRFLSRGYTTLMNTLFRLRVRYYNGTVIHRTANLKDLHISTSSFAYQSEILVKLLRAGKSYVEVPVEIAQQTQRKSKALRLKNVTSVLKAVMALFREIYFPPRRIERRSAESGS